MSRSSRHPQDVPEVIPAEADPAEEAGLGIAGGLHAFGAGIGFVVSTPSVWGYALVPAVVALFLLCGLGGLGIWEADHLSKALFHEPTGWWAKAGFWVVDVLLSVVAVMTAVVLALILAQPLSGFALDSIVYAHEQALTGSHSPHPGKLAALLRTWKVALFTFLVGTPILVTLFLIHLFFPPAAVVTVPLKFLVCSWLLAWDFLDYPLCIHGLGIRARFRWVGRHFIAFTTFGLTWFAFVIVPGMVLLLLPMGVAGATWMVVEADRRGRSLPSRYSAGPSRRVEWRGP